MRKSKRVLTFKKTREKHVETAFCNKDLRVEKINK